MENSSILPNPIDLRAERRRFSRIGLSLFLYLAITSILQLGLQAISYSAFPEITQSGGFGWVVTYVPQLCFGIPICILTLRTMDAIPFQRRSIGAGNFILYIIICIGVMYAGNIIGTFLSSVIGAITGGGQENPIANLAMTSSIWANFVIAVLIVPALEELIFRKLLIDRMRKYGDKVAIMVSALLFGLAHGNLYQFFYAFGLGLIFGYVYAQSGKLRYSVILHMIINFLGSVVSVLLLQGIDMEALSSITSLTDPEAIISAAGDMLPQLVLFVLYTITIIGLAITGVVLLFVRLRKAVFAPAVCPLPRGSGGFVTVFVNVGMLLYVVLCLFAVFFILLA